MYTFSLPSTSATSASRRLSSKSSPPVPKLSHFHSILLVAAWYRVCAIMESSSQNRLEVYRPRLLPPRDVAGESNGPLWLLLYFGAGVRFFTAEEDGADPGLLTPPLVTPDSRGRPVVGFATSPACTAFEQQVTKALYSFYPNG
jgi:hypothetical protein